LLFLTRDGCGLCQETRPLVTNEAVRRGMGLQEVDVDSEPDLKARYGARVPMVLTSAGQVVAEGNFTKRELRRSLKNL
jgi:hypothetical protein